jgi:transposase
MANKETKRVCMKKTPHQSYMAEFRELAVRQAIESNKSVSETAKELGVNANTLHISIHK